MRRHMRNTKVTKYLKDLSEKGKRTVEINTSHKAKGTSLAHTDTSLEPGKDKPVKNKVHVDVAKAKKSKSDLEVLMAHEFGHIVDRDKVKIKNAKSALSTSAKAKPLMSAIKQSEAYQKIKNDPYARDTGELFARAYAQYKTRKSKEIKEGLSWSPQDFRKIKSEMSKLLKK